MFREQRRYGNDPNVVVRSADATFNSPLKWKEPRGVFTCSWSDFFIEEADPWRDDAWKIINKAPRHTYLILTKRPERIKGRIPWERVPPDYVWMGTSVENDRFYRRIEELQAIEARLRFLSIEPLLGPMKDMPLDGIGWVIVGGESDPNPALRRPINLDWVRSIRDRCVDRKIPFFYKQGSGSKPGMNRLVDGRTWDEIPG